MSNIHASCVDYKGKGILLLGDSGKGKSGLCLELILNYGAVLIADDRVEIVADNNSIYASSPVNIKGLLEVRNVGILRLPAKDSSNIAVIIKLEESGTALERLPIPETYMLEGLQLPLLRFQAGDTAIAAKIAAFLNFPRL